jgi:hypothetical protein
MKPTKKRVRRSAEGLFLPKMPRLKKDLHIGGHAPEREIYPSEYRS